MSTFKILALALQVSLIDAVVAVSPGGEPITSLDAFFWCKTISSVLCDIDCSKTETLKASIKTVVLLRGLKRYSFFPGAKPHYVCRNFDELRSFGYTHPEVTDALKDINSLARYLEKFYVKNITDVFNNFRIGASSPLNIYLEGLKFFTNPFPPHR